VSRTKKTIAASVAALAAATSFVPAALSYDDFELSRIVAGEMPTVRDRFNGMGIRAGQFWFLPSIETGYFYDSNVFARSTGVVDDSGWYVSPTLDLKSDFGRHAFNVKLGGNHYSYFDTSSQDFTNFSGEADVRVDITRDFVATAGVKGFVGSEQVDENELPLAPGLTGTLDRDTVEFWGTLNKSFNRFQVGVGAAHKIYNYDDIGAVDQDYRDSNVTTVGGRVSYAFSPGYAWFADYRYNWRSYDVSSVDDSEGWRALTGVQFEITRLLRGEVGIGYMEQDYNNPAIGTVDGLSYEAALVWNPTPLMTVRLDASRDITDSILTNDTRTRTQGKVAIDYEVTRQLLLTPSLGVAYSDYEINNLEDLEIYAGLQAEYAMNRYLSLGARYKYIDRDFTGTVPAPASTLDYDRHIVGVYAKARF
jgi:hypothetical protein